MYLCSNCYSSHDKSNLFSQKKSHKKPKTKKSKVKLTKKCENCNCEFSVKKHDFWKKLCGLCWKKHQDILEELKLEMDRKLKQEV